MHALKLQPCNSKIILSLYDIKNGIFYQNNFKSTFHYKLFSIKEHMSKLAFTFLLAILALTHSCNEGQVICSDQQCHSPAYIEGCYIYSPDHQCAECEHSNSFVIKTTTSAMEYVYTLPNRLQTPAASSLTSKINVLNAAKAYC